MAVNIGPRIGIDGEQQYRQAMQNIIQQTRTLKSELKAAESGFSRNDSAMKKASERAKLLRDAIKSQKEHIRQCADMVKKCSDKYGEADSKTLKWKQALADAEAELNRLNGQLAQNNALVVWGEQVQQAGQKLQEIGRGVQAVGDAMTRYITTPIVGAGAASVKMAADFETGMAKVSTIANESEMSIGDMEKAIMELSDQTGLGATDIAEATYQAISAGRSTGEAVNFVSKASKLAKSGFTDVTTSVDTLTTVLNAYGLSADAAESISDKLITTQNLGKTTVAELGQNLGTVIPTAAAYGVDINNVAAAYVAMTKNGISTANATTFLNGMMNELGKSGTKASDILKEKTGKSFHECMESGMTFADVLGYVVKGAEESGLELNDMFGNVRAGRAAINIAADGAKEFNKALEAMGTTAGATDKAFAKVSKTTASDFNKAVNKIKNSSIGAGKAILTTFAPQIEKAFDSVKKGTSAFNNLSDAQKENIVKWAAIVAAAGPVISILGRLTQGAGLVVQGIGGVVKAIGTFSAAAEAAGGVGTLLSTSTLGIGLAAGGVVAPLAGLAAVMWNAGQKSREATAEQTAFAAEVAGVSAAADTASKRVGQIGEAIGQSAESIQTAGAGLSYYQDMLNSCYDAEGNLKEGMEKTANYALNELNAAMGSDYSTEFIAQAENSKAALEEINSAIDASISKMKERAIQQAFEADYGEALKGQAEARSALTKAEDTYTEAVRKQKEAVKEQIAASEISGAATDKTIERQNKAAAAVEQANKAVEEAGPAYKKAAGAAAEADAQVKGLEDTVKAMAEGTEESTEKAAEAYGNIGTAAEAAGESARSAVSETVSQNEADIESLRGSVEEKINAINEKRITPSVDTNQAMSQAELGAAMMQNVFGGERFRTQVGPVANTKPAATTAWNQMSAITKRNQQGNIDKVNGGHNAATVAKSQMVTITQSPMQGMINFVNGGPPAASEAHAQMVPIIHNPMQGSVSNVNGAESAASSAWNAMQSIISRPLTATVNIVQNVSRVVSEVVNRVAGHAEGGFVNHEQISWLAEGNKPEVVIPLDISKRARAIDLFKRTAAILGESPDNAYLPALAGAGNTTNVGGVTVNVYGAEGQDEAELADIVIDRLTSVIGAK